MRFLSAVLEHIQSLFEHAEERDRNSYKWTNSTPSFASHIFDWILREGSWLAVLVGLAIWGIWYLATKGRP